MTRTQTLATALIVLIVLAGAVARGSVIGTNTHVSADENGYVANANRILAARHYATFKWPPGTSVAFAIATRLSGHHSLRLATHASGPAQYTQLAIGILMLLLVAALAWSLAGAWAAVIATALVAGYEPLIDATRTFLSEPLGALVLLAAVGAAVLAHRRLNGHAANAHSPMGTQGGPDGRSTSAHSPMGTQGGRDGRSTSAHSPMGTQGDRDGRSTSGQPIRASATTRRELTALAGAGVVGGLACLTRGDLAIGMGVIALALALSGRPGWRRGLLRATVYLGALLLTLSPWLAYASSQESRFVPITTAGPDAFFIGSYLPGNGLLVPTEEKLAPEVCRHFPKDCGRYWQKSSAPLFRLIEARHPGMSENDAVNRENLENLHRYVLGKPAAFAAMLWGKFWKMWDNVWSGGNGTYHADTSRTQHLIYVVLAWIGLLGGAILTRRFALVVSIGVLLGVAALATLFNDQPRYNVSLMALLLCSGTAGAWMAVERLVAMRRARAPARAPSARTAR